mmetsp:Transcript_16650/g.36407  ORF Transcript_16650/g.36407 Transcript_16650/m.36407 type:complete len:220 (-) Transcript_16650:598-1257(-)
MQKLQRARNGEGHLFDAFGLGARPQMLFGPTDDGAADIGQDIDGRQSLRQAAASSTTTTAVVGNVKLSSASQGFATIFAPSLQCGIERFDELFLNHKGRLGRRPKAVVDAPKANDIGVIGRRLRGEGTQNEHFVFQILIGQGQLFRRLFGGFSKGFEGLQAIDLKAVLTGLECIIVVVGIAGVMYGKAGTTPPSLTTRSEHLSLPTIDLYEIRRRVRGR